MKNYKLKINGNDYNVDINEVEGQEIKLDVNGTSYVVTVDQEIKQQPKPVARPVAATSQVAPAASGTVQKSNAPAAGNKVTTPLPGTILDVFVNVGDSVKSGAPSRKSKSARATASLRAMCWLLLDNPV